MTSERWREASHARFCAKVGSAREVLGTTRVLHPSRRIHRILRCTRYLRKNLPHNRIRRGDHVVRRIDSCGHAFCRDPVVARADGKVVDVDRPCVPAACEFEPVAAMTPARGERGSAPAPVWCVSAGASQAAAIRSLGCRPPMHRSRAAKRVRRVIGHVDSDDKRSRVLRGGDLWDERGRGVRLKGGAHQSSVAQPAPRSSRRTASTPSPQYPALPAGNPSLASVTCIIFRVHGSCRASRITSSKNVPES